MLWRALKHVETGFYIDVGAAHPDEYSVTRAFYDHGWHGINVEPTRAYYQRLAGARPRDINLNMALAAQEGMLRFFDVKGTGLSTLDQCIAEEHRDAGWTVEECAVQACTLIRLVHEHVTGEVHFLKIDVEGAEANVLAGADFSVFRPWIIVVEATRPLTAVENHPNWEALLTTTGYRFVYFDGLNRFYIAEERWDDLSPAFAVPPNVFDDFIRAADSELFTRITAAEGHANRVEARAAEADARATEAEARAERAEIRATHAEVQAVQARAKADQAESRATQAESRVAQAEARMEQAEARRERAKAEREQAKAEAARAEMLARQAATRETQAQAQATQAELRAKQAEARAAEAESAATRATAEHCRALTEIAGLQASTSWRLTRPLREVGHLMRGEVGHALIEAGVSRPRVERLWRVAGSDGSTPKRGARALFYVIGRVTARVFPAAAGVRMERLAPGPWTWLARHNQAYLLAATGGLLAEAPPPGVDSVPVPAPTTEPPVAEPPPEIDSLREAYSAPTGPVVAPSPFELDQDFGIGRSRWKDFLSSRHCPPLDNLSKPGFWVLISGDADLPQVENSRRSISAVGLTPRGIRVTSPESFSTTLASLLLEADAGDLVWFLGAGDQVDCRSGGLLAQAAAAGADLCLFDTYFLEEDRVFPQLHPGFNEILGLNCNYFRSRFIARVGALRQIDTSATCTNAYETARALISLRQQRAGVSGTHLAGGFMRIEESHSTLKRESEDLIAGKDADFGRGSLNRIPRPEQRSVAVVICTQDRGHLLRQAVRSVLETGHNCIEEVVIVSHQPRNTYALKTLADIQHLKQVRMLTYEGPFNFSRQCNLGARQTSAPFLLFLNDDITPITPDWLERLLAPFSNPTVGVTGPLLLYPDERVQHSGMFLGYKNVAGHLLRSARLPDGDYLFMTQAPREVSCLTGAAMVIERSLFDDLNGFDPLLGTYLQDVDLSLRVHRSGRRLVFNPQAVLVHMESSSLRETLADSARQATREREHAYFLRRWAGALARDPFHNPNFDVHDESLRSLRPLACPRLIPSLPEEGLPA